MQIQVQQKRKSVHSEQSTTLQIQDAKTLWQGFGEKFCSFLTKSSPNPPVHHEGTTGSVIWFATSSVHSSPTFATKKSF